MKLKPLVGKHIGPKNIGKTRSQPNYPSRASSEDNLLFFLMVESSYQTKRYAEAEKQPLCHFNDSVKDGYSEETSYSDTNS